MHLHLALLLHSDPADQWEVRDDLCPSSHVTRGKLQALPQPPGHNAGLQRYHEEEGKGRGDPPGARRAMLWPFSLQARGGTGREAGGRSLPWSHQGRSQVEGRRGSSCSGLSPGFLATCALSSSPVERPSAQARTTPPAVCLTCGQTRS